MTGAFAEKFQITRRVTVETDLSVVIEPIVGGSWFEAALIPPSPRRARPGAPRSGLVWTLQYWASPVSFYEDPLKPADRISLQGKEWEVLTEAMSPMVGTSTGIHTTQILPVDLLYPQLGTLEEIGGIDVSLDVRLAVWSPDSSSHDTGMYTDLLAESPIEYRSILRPNRQFNMNGTAYKIVNAVVNYREPRVEMQIRRAGMSP